MRIPSNLTALIDEGLLDAVVRPLLSGKEAEVFLVRSGGQLRVAKVYKEAQNRTFKNRAEYTEGRKVRNSRDQRAMDKRSRHGKAQDEAAWRSTEVDMIYRLRDAGVRVPVPYNFVDGVLVMEMVADAEGEPAPRLAEVSLDADQARWVFDRLLAEVVRMLCAGVVHGDLSDFNVLMSADGPVIIDFPQSVDASRNLNARKLLLRDVANLDRFLSRFVPQRPRAFGEEMWDLYSQSLLTPETKLTGRHRVSERKADTRAVLELIGDANFDEQKRRERQGLGMRGVPPVRPQASHGGESRGPGGQRPPPPAAKGGGQRPPPAQQQQPYVGRDARMRSGNGGAYRPLPPPPPKGAKVDSEARPAQAENGAGHHPPPQQQPQAHQQPPPRPHQQPQSQPHQQPQPQQQHHHQARGDAGHRAPAEKGAGHAPPPQQQRHHQPPARGDSGQRPPQAENGGGHRPRQHTEGGHRPPPPVEGGHRPPQARPPQRAEGGHRPAHARGDGGHRPPQAQVEAGQRPAQGAEAVEAQAAPPRRRVVVSVSTNERRPGPRRNP